MGSSKYFDRKLYVNATEAAKILKVSTATFHSWRRQKAYIDQFSPRTIGARTYYNASRLKMFRKGYTPHARLPKSPKAVPMQRNDDISVTLDLILSVLGQLEKTISGLRGKLH